MVLSTQELSPTPFQYNNSFDWVIETHPSFRDVRFSNTVSAKAGSQGARINVAF
jgi:hypothetical protein